MIAAAVIASILAYIFVGALVFGHICGTLSGNSNIGVGPDYYYDEPDPWFGAIFWPFYVVVGIILSPAIARLIVAGEGLAVRRARVRVAAAKARIAEQEELEREMAEVEEDLESGRAA